MKFINNKENKLIQTLNEFINLSDSVKISVAFLRQSGLNLIKIPIIDLISRGGDIKILVGKDFGYTEPEALTYLESIGVSIKVFCGGQIFHPKCYLFENKNSKKIIIGSSNISASAFSTGVEWNLVIDDNKILYSEIEENFANLWLSELTKDLSDEILKKLNSNKNKIDASQLDNIATIKNEVNYNFEFNFRINKSFLKYDPHLLTILKEYNHLLKNIIKNNHHDTQLEYKEKFIKCFIYNGIAGYGEYYQIRIKENEFKKLNGKFKIGETIIVKFQLIDEKYRIKIIDL